MVAVNRDALKESDIYINSAKWAELTGKKISAGVELFECIHVTADHEPEVTLRAATRTRLHKIPTTAEQAQQLVELLETMRDVLAHIVGSVVRRSFYLRLQYIVKTRDDQNITSMVDVLPPGFRVLTFTNNEQAIETSPAYLDAS